MKNKTKYILQYAVASVSLMLVTNSIIQSFLLELGISESLVAVYLTVIQAVTACVTFLLTFFIDKIKNILKVFSAVSLAQLILIAALVFFCLTPGRSASESIKFFSILSAGAAANILQAVYSVLTYKVPYHIMDIADYGDATGKAGVTVGIAGCAVSLVLAFFQSKFNYFSVMLVFFLLAAGGFLISFSLIRSYKKVEDASIKTETRPVKHINILKYKPFYILLAPNILRAYCEGIALAAMTVGSYLNITNTSSGANMNSIAQIATIIGCFVFTMAIKKISVGAVLLVSSIGLAVAMPTMYITGSLSAFYIAYAFTYIFVILIQYGVPFAVTKIVDYDVIGQYTTFRMLIHTLGLALASATVIPLVKILGGPLTMLIAVLGQIISGAVYYIYLKKLHRK